MKWLIFPLLGLMLGLPRQLASGAEPRPIDVICTVEGRTTILALVPEGSKVKKGDLICELDSSRLKDELINQEIIVATAKSDHEAARQARAVAEISRKDGVAEVDNEIAATENDVKVAELDIKLAKLKIESGKAAQATGQGRGQLDQGTVDLARAQAALSRAKAKLKNLKGATRSRHMLEGDLNLKKAIAEELSKAQALTLQELIATKKRAQITACRIVAPADGTVVYIQPPSARSGIDLIEENATVRERQKIMWIIPR